MATVDWTQSRPAKSHKVSLPLETWLIKRVSQNVDLKPPTVGSAPDCSGIFEGKHEVYYTPHKHRFTMDYYACDQSLLSYGCCNPARSGSRHQSSTWTCRIHHPSSILAPGLNLESHDRLPAWTFCWYTQWSQWISSETWGNKSVGKCSSAVLKTLDFRTAFLVLWG